MLFTLASACSGWEPTWSETADTSTVPTDTSSQLAPRWEGRISLGDAPLILEGAATTQCSGRIVAPAGDVDGDGLADMLVTGPCDDLNGMFSEVGSAWLVRGGVAPGRHDLASVAALAIHGTEDDHWAGSDVTGLGDVDGDGLDDIAVGYPWIDDGQSGSVALLRGNQTGSIEVDAADGTLLGPPEAGAGAGLALVSDLTGDGGKDLLVLGFETVWLVPALQFAEQSLDTIAAATLTGFTTNRESRTSAVEDLDGDGANELTLASIDYQAWVFQAPLSGTIDTTAAISQLEAPPGSGGRLKISAGGDAEGDGLPDLAFGLQNVDGAPGGAWLVPAPPAGLSELAAIASVTFLPGPDDLMAGSDIRWLGDLDGDGADDLAISVVRDSESAPDAGATYLFYGPFSGQVDMASASAKFLGETEADMASGVAPVGDLDGDGRDELAFGADHRDIGGRSGGSTYVFPAVPSAM